MKDSRGQVFLRGTFQLFLFLGLVACGSLSLAVPSATPVSTSTPTVVDTPTSLPVATPTPAPTPTQTPIPLNLTDPPLVVLVENLVEPDDLVLAPDGSIFFSDVGAGNVQRYSPDGQLQTIISGLQAPEGIVILPDGSLVIAEQGKDRLVRYDLQTRVLTPFFKLSNPGGLLGVDGLALDTRLPNPPTIIVPDSPNGTVLRLSLDGRIVTQVASGLARPTGAWVEPDGSLLVVDENGNALYRLHPDSRLELLANLPIPDDVVEDRLGHIFVNTLGDNAIHLILAATQKDTILVSGLDQPQGLIFDADGNLIVADSGHHRLIKIVIH